MQIAELLLPRYPIECFAFPIILKNENFLVVYIQQQATSHSSTLFVLDKNFDIQYEEHLLGAKAVGYGTSEKYGIFFVVKSEDFWFSNGVDKPEVKINGDWMYYLNHRR